MVSGTLLLDGKVDDNGRAEPGHGPKVLVDKRQTMYSFAGDVFAMIVSAAAVCCAAWLSLSRTGKKQKEVHR